MSEPGEYHDVRADFWSQCWSAAESYEAYLKGSDPTKASRWQSVDERIPPMTPQQIESLDGHGRQLNVLVVSGVWCGDCVRQVPMIRQIVDACDEKVSLRVIDRDQKPELRDEVRILGAARVPVAVFLSEDFHEVGRVGDRTLLTYRRKAETELGAACAVPSAKLPADELADERDEWALTVERMLLMARLAPPLRTRHGD